MTEFVNGSRILKCRHPFFSAIGFCIVLAILILYNQPMVLSILGHDYQQPPDLNWLREHIRTTSEGSRRDASVGESGDLTRRECMELLNLYQQQRRGGRSWSFCADDFAILRKCMRSPELGATPLPNFFLRNATTTIVDPLYSEASVAFVHLPKSGGTSVEEFLFPIVGQQGFLFGTQIGISHCSEFTKAAHILSKSKNQLFLYSKRSYGLHEFAPKDKPFMYVTWLREPVDRIVSAYYYIKKTRPTFHTMYMKYVAKSRNLTECLQRIGTITSRSSTTTSSDFCSSVHSRMWMQRSRTVAGVLANCRRCQQLARSTTSLPGRISATTWPSSASWKSSSSPKTCLDTSSANRLSGRTYRSIPTPTKQY
ncbi:uncharacterized protein [Ptychodera flava]|uniref:uncharacterized protein n=1 Tax=Ptychodera flava TaxID=63121 RepID=UPI00396A9F1D